MDSTLFNSIAVEPDGVRLRGGFGLVEGSKLANEDRHEELGAAGDGESDLDAGVGVAGTAAGVVVEPGRPKPREGKKLLVAAGVVSVVALAVSTGGVAMGEGSMSLSCIGRGGLSVYVGLSLLATGE